MTSYTSRARVGIERIEAADQLRALGLAWSRLFEASTTATPFQSHAWATSWWELVGERDEHELALELMLVALDGHVRALAPFVIDRDARELRFLGDPWADYLDILVDPLLDLDARALVFSAITTALRAGIERQRYDRVCLAELPPESCFLAWLDTQPQLAPHRRPSSVCPELDLHGEAGARASDRREYQVKRRRLQRRGQLRCALHLEPRAIAERMPAYTAMHMRQWVGRPDRGFSFDDPAMLRFYTESVPRLAAAGLLVLTELCLDERPIGYYYGYRLRDTFYGYRPSFEVELRRLSPGGVMHLEMFELLRAAGYRRFDFMRGDMSYKHRYASRINVNTNYVEEDAR